MTEPVKIELPPEALAALEKDGVVVMPKTVHPSVKKAALDALIDTVFGDARKPTFRFRCMMYSSHAALNIGRRIQ